jgi:hypothetical protein
MAAIFFLTELARLMVQPDGPKIVAELNLTD